jgi:hypothetical protein
MFDHHHESNLHIVLAPMLLLSVLMAYTFIPHKFCVTLLFPTCSLLRTAHLEWISGKVPVGPGVRIMMRTGNMRKMMVMVRSARPVYETE